MDFSIQKLAETDLALAKELLLEWQRDEPESAKPIPEDAHLNHLLKRADFHVYVALVKGKVVGGLTAYEMMMFDQEENEMFLYEIGVSAAHRKKGIARALVDALQITCSDLGIKVIYVGTEPDNTPAKHLYLSTGAKEERVAWFTYGEGDDGEKG